MRVVGTADVLDWIGGLSGGREGKEIAWKVQRARFLGSWRKYKVR